MLLDLGQAVVNLISGIDSIVAERTSTNEASSAIPAVLPHQLVQELGRDFNTVVRKYRERLLGRWPTSKIELLEQEFQALHSARASEKAFRDTLSGCNEMTSFEDGWATTGGRFPVLREFCGGLATVFPGTATVESDFSMLKYIKNDFRSSLTDFSLEGILHAKQFRQLLRVETN